MSDLEVLVALASGNYLVGWAITIWLVMHDRPQSLLGDARTAIAVAGWPAMYLSGELDRIAHKLAKRERDGWK